MGWPKRRVALILVGSLVVAGTVGGVFLAGPGGGPRSVSTGGGCDTTVYPPPTSTSSTSVQTVPQTTTTPSTIFPTTPASTAAPSQTALREGSTGPEVTALQQRLLDLGFWLGEADGRFGSSTMHAVVAFQKAHGLTRDGVAGPATLQALSLSSREVPRSTTGHLIEISLSRQILLVVDNGRVTWVMDACTGIRPGSTPKGTFRVFRQVDGYDRSPLGVLYRPKYFSSGVAVHGYPLVPPQPASHGCVRITNAEMDWLWAHNAMPIGTTVWVY